MTIPKDLTGLVEQTQARFAPYDFTARPSHPRRQRDEFDPYKD